MMRRLGLAGDVPGDDGPPRPDRTLYAVGDVHGRADLLDGMLRAIEADARARGPDDARIVMLGDYVDRGDGARDVLRMLAALDPEDAVCLSGNHERMMLDFIDDPEAIGPLWLRNGGGETLASFGIDDPDGDPARAAAALRSALSEDGLEDWVRGLPLMHRSGDVVCVHAGLDPRLPPEEQEERVMLWGTPRFARQRRADGLWVVHGHTITPTPTVEGRRIACDTGAYFTERLTAAVLVPGESVRFLTAEPG